MARNTWYEDLRRAEEARKKRKFKSNKKQTYKQREKGPELEDAKLKIKTLFGEINRDMSNRPTAAQQRMWNRVFDAGCVACRMNGKFTYPEIHHVKEYGYRNHDKVYGLCPVHHKATSMVKGIPNRHGTPKEFVEKFGTDQELFEQNQKYIEGVK